MNTIYGLAADAIVIVHMIYVLTVVLGLPITWIGILLKRPWARNFWWRCGHLSMILVVVFEVWAGITCPLTTWEVDLRRLAGQKIGQGAFIANCVHDWLFYEAPPWVFAMVYSAYGLLVLTSFVAAPPRWPSSRNASVNPS